MCAGYLNIYLSAKTFDGRSIVVNINREQNDDSRRNAHLVSSSPVTLVSWDQLLKRGWRMAEDTSYIFHRSAEANVYLTQRNGLFYLPICAEPRTQTPLITTGAVHADSGSKSSSASNSTVCPASTTFTSGMSLLGILHDENGGSVRIAHSKRTVSIFAGSAKLSIKMFLTMILRQRQRQQRTTRGS